MLNQICPTHSRKHICKPARANAQTKGLQKSCNFADTHEAIMKELSVFLQYGRCA